MARATDIDRLIEEGLNRYGVGDLDGALLSWEEALAIDPENAQANSYVDYVRMNYELLHTDTGPNVVFDDAGMPFGIEEEPEYVIEIVAGEAPRAGEPTIAPMYMDPLDEGWFIEEEATRDLTQQTKGRTPSKDLEAARTISAELPPQTFELEAEEPPVPVPEVSFESSTREYGKDVNDTARQPTNEFADDISSFRAEATPLGFGQMETEVKKRDLGFVQPTQGPAQMEVRLRTPTSQPTKEPSLDLELGDGGALSRTARGMPPIQKTPASTADDLIDSLPRPRHASPVGGSPTAEPATRIPTRDLPPTSRPPAPALDLPDAPEEIALAAASTRDLNDRLGTAPASPSALAQQDDPIITTTPTRELGLRPGKRPPSVYPDEDAPTRQSDARAIRAEATAAKQKPAGEDGTRQDIVLPFDPIDARSAQILDEIDAEGSDDEPKEDRTRRRITALLDRAMAWNSQEDLDRAVCAVDLALSEDPNSALAQKLIHRNRDTIMTVFQNYMGDLERQPQLARPLHELSSASINPRAAFLLSRIDGTLTIDEILDVSGMPRLEAYRHLCQLFLRGILR